MEQAQHEKKFDQPGQAQHEKKIIFSHGIGEAVVETNENEIVIPCVLYTPEVTLNVLSLDQLLAQGFVITYGHDKCRISYMCGEDKKVYDGESDYGKGKGCDVKTESMIAKQNKYLEEYFDSIDPKDAYSMGGYLSVSLGNKWKDVAMIHGLPKEHDEDLKECYKRTIDLVKCYNETTLRAWYKEGLVKYEETKEVEIGCDHAKEGNPQEHVGLSKSGLRVVKDNTSGRFKNVQGGETHFGVILEGCNISHFHVIVRL
ncbi:ARID DNA-binding domain-containing protein [Tanacetum coccineum]